MWKKILYAPRYFSYFFGENMYENIRAFITMLSIFIHVVCKMTKLNNFPETHMNYLSFEYIMDKFVGKMQWKINKITLLST